MELEMPKKQKVPPCNYEKERVKKRRVQRAEKRKAAFLAWKREAQERLARLKDAIQRNNARSLIAITEDNPEGIELNAIAIERVHRKAMCVGMYYHLLLERKTNWEDYEEHDQIQHTQAKAAEAWVCKDTIYRWKNNFVNSMASLNPRKASESGSGCSALMIICARLLVSGWHQMYTRNSQMQIQVFHRGSFELKTSRRI
jgi:hypothetical protein